MISDPDYFKRMTQKKRDLDNPIWLQCCFWTRIVYVISEVVSLNETEWSTYQ